MIEVDAQAKREIVGLAREAIEGYLETGAYHAPHQVPHGDIFEAGLGVFVTLTKGPAKELRGCIGRLESRGPLWRTLMQCAVGAAFEDSRFSPVTRAEYPDLHVEVSLLSPLTPVYNTNEITLGTHGVVMMKSGKSAVFLPEVAVMEGWDVTTLLTRLSQKAGLPGEAWRSGAAFRVFTSEKFGD